MSFIICLRSPSPPLEIPLNNRKAPKTFTFSMLSTVPETIRTSDPSLRRRVLYPLSYEDICGCCLSSHLLIIYDFFCFVTSLCRIIDIPLHPDNALESSSDLRFSVEIFPIDADIKLQIVAAEFHHADFFFGQLILPDRKLDNLS